MPGYARQDIVREGEIGIYHCWSRCVQSAFLCGIDPCTGQNFEHRRVWIRSLLEYQAAVFAVDVGNYTVLSNHQHLIARTRPDIAATWSDEEVAWRWKLAWPSWREDRWLREPTDEEIEEVLAQPERLPQLRANLASLSWFMARWKEPIAKAANRETHTKGHFYEQRFGCREILDDAANLCCNVYLDLNQRRAGMARSLDECTCSAIHDRLRAWRCQEAQESVDEFQASAPPEYVLETADMQQLLADCFLAPLGNQGPSLLLGAADQPLRQGPEEPPLRITTKVAECAAEPTVHVAPPAESLNTDTSATEPPQETRSASTPEATDPPASPADRSSPMDSRRRRPVPTWVIHRRLNRHRRRRASDHAYLGIPRAEYLGMVQWTDQQLGGERPEPLPTEWDTVLRRLGVEPSQWLHVVEHFGDLFARAVGSVRTLAEVALRRGVTRLQGSRACGDVFT